MSNQAFSIIGIDHLEFFVGNAKQAAYYYSRCFGFETTAYRGLETGERKTSSYVMEQGNIRFVLTSAMSAEHPIARSVALHGDTIAIVAMAVPDVKIAYQHVVERGAVAVIPPTTQSDASGTFRYAAIRTFGDVLVKFVERQHYSGGFAPGFVSCPASNRPGAGLLHIDHVVGNVERGSMDLWTQFFVNTMGFDLRMHFNDQAISTEYSALMSKVLQNGDKTIVNINEPADGLRKSQIDEYLEAHYGPGIQHIGLATSDIVQTVLHLKQSGVEFLPIPQTYYESLESWVQEVDVPVEKLAELGILIDRDQDGYLLQLFTKPVGDRPTLFFEIIERHGSRGFGAGNFKSLFVALEREQALRGNL
jgi:4-hydroxyphenylpyruvate dioxygenase